MAYDPKRQDVPALCDPAAVPALPAPPLLPERAAIYIAPDGRVHFGALFAGLVPVAAALGAPAAPEDLQERGPLPRPAALSSRGSDSPAPPEK